MIPNDNQRRRWHVYADSTAVAAAVVASIAHAAAQAIAARGAFHIVLAGGRTPQAIYAKLRLLATDWSAWFIYFGDERCLPYADPGRNDAMARTVWLDHVAIPTAQIYAIPSELGPERGAAEYSKIIATIDRFDLVLLGLGEDGHTASLFPDAFESNTTASTLAVYSAPKPPAERISLTAARLSRARQVFFVATGADKRAALLCWRRDEPIPAAQINPEHGVDIYTDIDPHQND